MFIIDNFGISWLKNLITSWILLITLIGIPTPNIAVGMGIFSTILRTVLVIPIIVPEIVKASVLGFGLLFLLIYFFDLLFLIIHLWLGM